MLTVYRSLVLVKILKTTMKGSIRAIYVWPWNENVQTIQKQQKNGNRANWLVYQTDTNAGGFWLVKGTIGWKKPSCPRTCWKSTDTLLWCHTATWLANQTMPSPYYGFLWRGNEEALFWSFHPLTVKTNNIHLLKPFFKVIWKSLNCLKLPPFFPNSDLLIVSKVTGIPINLAYVYAQFYMHMYI